MSKPVVFVIGATGNVGAATISSLSAKYADRVEIRAGVRDLEKADKLKAIANVTVVQATMGDSSLVSVLAGVSTLYIVTPGIEQRTHLSISTAQYAKQAGVKHLLVITSKNASKFPNTNIGASALEIERNITKLGVPYTFISLPWFLENNFNLSALIIKEGTICYPLDPDKSFPYMAVENIGNASAAILANPEEHVGKWIFLVSENTTYNDFAKVLSEALGREIKYVRVPYETISKSMIDNGASQWMVDGFLEISKLVDSSFPAIEAAEEDYGNYSRLTGEQPMDVKTWVAKYAGRFQ